MDSYSKEDYILRSTSIQSAKKCYEDRLTATRHLDDLLEQSNESKKLGHELKVSLKKECFGDSVSKARRNIITDNMPHDA